MDSWYIYSILRICVLNICRKSWDLFLSKCFLLEYLTNIVVWVCFFVFLSLLIFSKFRYLIFYFLLLIKLILVLMFMYYMYWKQNNVSGNMHSIFCRWNLKSNTTCEIVFNFAIFPNVCSVKCMIQIGWDARLEWFMNHCIIVSIAVIEWTDNINVQTSAVFNIYFLETYCFKKTSYTGLPFRFENTSHTGLPNFL